MRSRLLSWFTPACALAMVLGLAGRAGAQYVVTTEGPGPGPNFPANEPASDAIDNDLGSKYLNFAAPELISGLLITPLGGTTTVTGLRFAAANDGPERDPITYVLEGSLLPTTDPNAVFVPISAGSTGLLTDPGRNTFDDTQLVLNGVGYSTYRLTFPTVRNPLAANSMQIGEIELLNALGADVTTGATATAIHLVPEPGTVALLVVGGMVLMRRRNH